MPWAIDMISSQAGVALSSNILMPAVGARLEHSYFYSRNIVSYCCEQISYFYFYFYFIFVACRIDCIVKLIKQNYVQHTEGKGDWIGLVQLQALQFCIIYIVYITLSLYIHIYRLSHATLADFQRLLIFSTQISESALQICKTLVKKTNDSLKNELCFFFVQPAILS